MTYNETLASYQRLLEANPGKALQIGDDCYAVLINGTLSGAYATLDGAVDLGTIFHFDREAWDAECECWDGDVSGMQTGRPQKLSATPDHFGKVLPHVLSRTQRHRARHDPDRPVQWLQPAQACPADEPQPLDGQP